MREPTGLIKAANLKTSERLQLTMLVLEDGEWHTTVEIRDITNSCAVHTDVAELRAEPNKIAIERCYHGKINGRRVFAYRLAQRSEAA